MVTVFKENLNLQLPLIFYSSIRFVFETAFISEQIAENRSGALLEISDKFITKFNIFSYMILQFRLKTVWKISKPQCMTLKIVARQFCLEGHSLYHKSQGSTFRNAKRFEDKAQCLLSPDKVWGNFFIKKLCMEEQTFLGKFLGVCFTWGLMIRSCEGGQFLLSLTLTQVIDILFEKLTPQIGE